MPTKIEITEHVQAPVERVFALAADFANASERIGSIIKVEMLTEGPVGVGTRFVETRRMFKREAREEMEVVAFEPPHRYALAADSCGCRYLSELRFTGEAGGTRVVMTFEATPLSLLARIMSVLSRPMIKMLRHEVQRDLADLKAAAEHAPRSRGDAAASA